MTDTRLEETLRATLAARADTVTRGPDWQPTDVGVVHRTPRRRTVRWLAPLAAAVVVGAVVASVVAIESRSSGRHFPPATHRPTPTTSGPTPDNLQPLRCTRPLAESWHRAIAAGTISTHGRQLTPLAVDSAGGVLADEASVQTTRYINFTVPYSHDLVLVTARGQTRPLYSAPPPASWGGRRIGTVSSEGDWVALALLVQAASGGQGPVQIELVNLTSGATRTVRPTTPNDVTIVLGPAILNGSVYWTEIQSGLGLDYGPLYRYDIATGQRTIVDRRATSGPYVVAGTLSWTHEGGNTKSDPRRPVLPAGVNLAAVIERGSPLLTDGRTYVWQDPVAALAIRASRPGAGGAVTAVPRGAGGRLAGLTGDLVWWDGARGAWVADLRTGAASRVTEVSTAQSDHPVIAAGHTAVVGLDDHRLAVLDTAQLPALHC